MPEAALDAMLAASSRRQFAVGAAVFEQGEPAAAFFVLLSGRLRVKGTLGGFLFVGFSWQFLWWSDPEERRASRQKLMASGEHRAADRCRSCGLVAFQPFPR